MLLQMGAKVTGIALPPHTTPTLFSILDLEQRMRSHFVNLSEKEEIALLLQREEPEIVFHLAAQSLVKESLAHPVETWMTNTIGTLHLLEAIRTVPSVQTCVCITTDKVYAPKNTPHIESDPLGGKDPYSASKAASELVIDSYRECFLKNGCTLSSARAGNVLGGGDWSKDRLIPDLMRSLFVDKKPLLLRSPLSIRPWQHVLDPLFGYLLLGKKRCEGAWNFAPASQGTLTVQEIVERGISFFGKGSFELGEKEERETAILKLDSKKALKIGWEPYFTTEETLQLTYSWYKAYYAGEDVVCLTEEEVNRRLQSDLSEEKSAAQSCLQ